MDISTMIVDLLRNSKENEILNRGGPIAQPAAPAANPARAEEMKAGVTELTVPGYTAYKREALANGEPVMSPEEFQNAARQ